MCPVGAKWYGEGIYVIYPPNTDVEWKCGAINKHARTTGIDQDGPRQTKKKKSPQVMEE